MNLLNRLDLKSASKDRIVCLNPGAEENILIPLPDSQVLPSDFRLLVPCGIEVYRVLGIKLNSELIFVTTDSDFAFAFLSRVSKPNPTSNTGDIMSYPWYSREDSTAAFKRTMTMKRGDPTYALKKPRQCLITEHPLSRYIEFVPRKK